MDKIFVSREKAPLNLLEFKPGLTEVCRYVNRAFEKKRKSIKKYNSSDKGKACRERYRKSKKGKLATHTSRVRLRLKLKKTLADLFTNGINRCMHCNGAIEQFHHSNPSDAKCEKMKFGSTNTIDARTYQIKQHKKNKNYIVPLCKQCHKEEHKRLKRG